MKRLLLIALTVGLVAQPAEVSGQLLYNGIPDATEYLKFIQGSGVAYNGVQVGPYLGQLTSDSPLQPAFSIYCVDYNHYAKSQSVNVTSLASASLGNTRLGDYGAYQKAAYLSSLFHDPAHAGQWGQIHAAIWNITSGYGTANTYNTMANTYAATFSTDGWYVLSPFVANGPAFDGTGQEFLMRRVSVPEPTAFLLLATGLLLLAAFSRKRLVELTRQ